MKTKANQNVTKYTNYEVSRYDNSDKEPFGLTIKGQNRLYIEAHGSIKQSMIKGKTFKGENATFNVQDVEDKKGFIQISLEVFNSLNEQGNVDLKIYAPSSQKKKGATIEMRKYPGFDYFFVENVLSIILANIDSVIESTEKPKSKEKESGLSKLKMTFKPNLHRCDFCEFESKSRLGIENHKKEYMLIMTNHPLNVAIVPIKLKIKRNQKCT